MKKLFFDWEISDHTGWGIYGLNLLINGIKDQRFDVYPLNWPPSFKYPLNPIISLELDKYLSNKAPNTIVNTGDILLTALGNSVEKKDVDGILKEIGITFLRQIPYLRKI